MVGSNPAPSADERPRAGNLTLTLLTRRLEDYLQELFQRYG